DSLDSITSDLTGGLVSVYSNKVRTMAGFVYSYAVKNKYYASIYKDQTGYVSKQIYLSPLCLFMLIRIGGILQQEADTGSAEIHMENMLLDICKQDKDSVQDKQSLDEHILEMMEKVDSASTLMKHFKKNKYDLF